jgi:hypothetical protein
MRHSEPQDPDPDPNFLEMPDPYIMNTDPQPLYSPSLTAVLLCSLQFSDSDLEGGGGGPTLVRSTRNRLSRLHGLKKKKVRHF